MGIRYKTTRMLDLHNYDPEYNEDGTEKHIVCDGARYHVVSYHCEYDIVSGKSRTRLHCSEPNCEINRREERLDEDWVPHVVFHNPEMGDDFVLTDHRLDTALDAIAKEGGR